MSDFRDPERLFTLWKKLTGEDLTIKTAEKIRRGSEK